MFFYAHRDEDCRIERIAEGCGVSPSTLARCVQEATGLSPGIFFRRIRMEWAFRSLRSLDQAVIQVALAAGFDNHAAFSRAFRAIFGCSPTGARKVLSIHRELESIELAEPDIVEMEAFSVRGVVSQGSYFTSAARGWRDLAVKLGPVNEPASPLPLFVAMAMDDPHEGVVKDDEVRFFCRDRQRRPSTCGFAMACARDSRRAVCPIPLQREAVQHRPRLSPHLRPVEPDVSLEAQCSKRADVLRQPAFGGPRGPGLDLCAAGGFDQPGLSHPSGGAR